MLNDVWERGKDELVDVWLSTVNDLFEHSNDHLSGDDSVALDHLVHFDTNGGFSLVLISDEAVDIEVDEAVLRGELLGDLLSQDVRVGTRSDVDDAWLNVSIDILHSLLETSVSID